MSWLFSQALVAEYSQATCWAGAPCAQLSVMPTQHKFWRNDKTVEPCDLSRFGLTCAALTEDRGADLLTWFLGASLARTSALPAEAQASTAPAAGCGATWRGSLARFDHASATWRTAQPSLLGDSDECSVIWPRSGMTAGGQCWELPTLTPPTRGTASGSLVPTPTAVGFECQDIPKLLARRAKYAEKYGNNGFGLTLNQYVKVWPTPDAHMGSGGRTSKSPPTGKRASGTKQQITLNDAVKWAAPTARDWRSGKASQATHDKNSRPLSEQIGGSLNPTWVEWLMGWPIGWTVLEHSETDRCPGAQPQPGECSLLA